MTDFIISVLHIPKTIDAPDAADFIEMTYVRNAVEADVVGSHDFAYEPAELLPGWQNPYEPQVCLVAKVDGRIVARGLYMPTAEEGASDAWLSVEVLPEFRCRGIGAALYKRLGQMCSSDGRTVEQTQVMHKPVNGGSQLASPTGFGSVPLESAETRFLLGHGFELQQVDRVSVLELPIDDATLSGALAHATAASGRDYRVVTWVGRTPERWVSDMAFLHQRMSTDTPAAGLESVEEAWDDDRIRSQDDTWDASPRTMLTTAVEHVPSGTLVGFTELSIPPEQERPSDQRDTLVLKEHRGHRLGLLLKLENLKFMAEKFPGHPSVNTFNAEENRPMLDVNEAIGFVSVGYAGAWKKTAKNVGIKN